MERPICVTSYCNNLAKPNGVNKHGRTKYYKKCSPCRKGRKFSKYGSYKKEALCSYCSFIPEHSCQLDVDHIDGNKENNDLSNLQTLCANCHRLKTFKNKDWT